MGRQKKPVTLVMAELATAIQDLRHLPPRAIALMLKRRKIRGRPGTTGACPLALHMKSGYSGTYVVGQKWIIHRSGDHVVRVATPPNMAAFMRMFDQGEFTELLDVPPRCRPKPSGQRTRPGGADKRKAKHKPWAERLHLARDVRRFG